MNVEELRTYVLQKHAVTEGFPFGEDTLVFKINGKVFLLVALDDSPIRERPAELVERFAALGHLAIDLRAADGGFDFRARADKSCVVHEARDVALGELRDFLGIESGESFAELVAFAEDGDPG